MRDSSDKSLTLSTELSSDGVVKLHVEDTGGGIPEELLPRLFEPFFTTKPHGVGLGLGLSISRDIIRSFHGELSVSNLPDGGACFTVVLPEQRLNEPVAHTLTTSHD